MCKNLVDSLSLGFQVVVHETNHSQRLCLGINDNANSLLSLELENDTLTLIVDWLTLPDWEYLRGGSGANVPSDNFIYSNFIYRKQFAFPD